MDGMMGNEGINKLAGVLQSRMHAMMNRTQVLDFGEIQGDMSLLTNRFPCPIPQADYMVCRQLALGRDGDTLTETPISGEHPNHTAGDGKHRHNIPIPEKMRSVQPGDRVLVAWAGDDPCVIDIILPGTAVKGKET